MRGPIARWRSRPDGVVRAWYLWAVVIPFTLVHPAYMRAVLELHRFPHRCLRWYWLARTGRLVEHLPHTQAVARALWLWRWSQLNHAGRRQVRRRVGAFALASALFLMGSIASPVGMGNDGQRAYDMATRTWFGTFIGTVIGGGGLVYDVTNPSYAGGAKLNGITDDTTAILATVAAGGANSIIWIPKGTSFGVISNAIVVSQSNVWFDGPGTLKLANAANHGMIRFTNSVTGGGVRNITLDGNKANNTGSDGFGNQGVQVGHDGTVCTFISVTGAKIENTLNDGVYIKAGVKCQVQNCYFTGCGTDVSGGGPIHILQGAIDCQANSNLAEACAYGINAESNNIANCLRISILGNVVSNCFGAHDGYQQAGGISIQGALYTLIEGNVTYGATTIRGIYLAPGYSASSSDFSLIEGNICHTNIHNGIDITGNCLKVIGNHAESSGQSGIFLSGNPLPVDSTFNILSNNTCRNNGTLLGVGSKSQAGIVMNWTSPGDITDNLFIGNSCFDNGTGSQLYGILQWTAGPTHYKRNVIANNQLKGNATAPIFLLSTTDTVRDNSGANPHNPQAAAFAASFTPDLTLGDYIAIGALTGNITINNFTALSLYPGQIVTFQFTQDGTGGRTITWNAAYKTGFQPTNAASSSCTISFYYDGTNWQQIAGQVATDSTSQTDLGALNLDVWIRSGFGVDSAQSTGQVVIGRSRAGSVSVVPSTSFSKDLKRSRQTPTEAVLVSGVDATTGENIEVTLTAARLVGLPLNPAIGQHLIFTLIQGGAGAFAVTWNAVFKKTWSDAGNATGTRSSIEYVYNGTNWNQVGGQAPYV